MALQSVQARTAQMFKLPFAQGTWYRNGPGTFEMGGQPMHVFDGHGLVGRAFRQKIWAGRATGKVRWPARSGTEWTRIFLHAPCQTQRTAEIRGCAR